MEQSTAPPYGKITLYNSSKLFIAVSYHSVCILSGAVFSVAFSKSDTYGWPISVARNWSWILAATSKIRRKSRQREVAFIGGCSCVCSRWAMQRIVLEYRIVPQSESAIKGYLLLCNVWRKLKQREYEMFILKAARVHFGNITNFNEAYICVQVVSESSDVFLMTDSGWQMSVVSRIKGGTEGFFVN